MKKYLGPFYKNDVMAIFDTMRLSNIDYLIIDEKLTDQGVIKTLSCFINYPGANGTPYINFKWEITHDARYNSSYYQWAFGGSNSRESFSRESFIDFIKKDNEEIFSYLLFNPEWLKI